MAVAVLREVTIAERFEQESMYAWTVRRDKKSGPLWRGGRKWRYDSVQYSPRNPSKFSCFEVGFYLDLNQS